MHTRTRAVARPLCALLLASCAASGDWQGTRDVYCEWVASSRAEVDQRYERAAASLDAYASMMEAAAAIDDGRPLSREDARAMASARASNCALIGAQLGELQGYVVALQRVTSVVAAASPAEHDWRGAAVFALRPLECTADAPADAADEARSLATAARGAAASYAEERARTLATCERAGWRGE